MVNKGSRGFYEGLKHALWISCSGEIELIVVAIDAMLKHKHSRNTEVHFRELTSIAESPFFI